MKRKIEWIDRLDDGVKRKVRVTFPGKSLVKWQFQRSDEGAWDYDSPATADDWEYLEGILEGHYNRRRAKYETLELVRKLRRAAFPEVEAEEREEENSDSE
jgi:hypothetical protein